MTFVLIESPELHGISEAYEWRDKYYERYHPMGYGTSLKINLTRPDHYIVTGSRWDSCD